jgi:hypothetical protein
MITVDFHCKLSFGKKKNGVLPLGKKWFSSSQPKIKCALNRCCEEI